MTLPGFVTLTNKGTGNTIDRTPVDAQEIMKNDSNWSTVIEKAEAPVESRPDLRPAPTEVKSLETKTPATEPEPAEVKDPKKA